MSQFFKETAQNKTDLKMYGEHFDLIDWSKKEKIHSEDCALLINVRHGCTCEGVNEKEMKEEK